MKWLLLAVLLATAGCAYAPDDVDDFDIRCESCSQGLGVFTTRVHCRADSVLHTAVNTKCRGCGRYLAEPGDEVGMNALSGGVFVIKHGSTDEVRTND